MSSSEDKRLDIKDLTAGELEALVVSLGEKPYRARQMMRWIYQDHISSFEEMTDLPRTFRLALAEAAYLSTLTIAAEKAAGDGTRKFLFTLYDGNRIESVLIPEKSHTTVCLSTQVGCALGCTFCRSGKHGLIRNLRAAEITNQLWTIRKNLLPRGAAANVVFMGMGEPLANYDNTLKALRILTDPAGFAVSHRRITVSTAGLIPQIKKLGCDLPVNLAISLNASNNALRSALMPVNRHYPLDKLIESASSAVLPPRKRITFEYILIDGVNDSPADAKALVSLLQGIRCKINLIPFNEHGETDFKRPDMRAVEHFRSYLSSRNLTAIVRYSKGNDIAAACGQLGCAEKR